MEDTKALIAELEELDFITDFIKYKIADILPKYPEDVRAIFSKEIDTSRPTTSIK